MNLTKRRKLVMVGWGIALAIALVAPLVASARQMFVLMLILVLAVFATSYNILLGYTGMVSFAHASYYGVGAYTVALVFKHYDLSALWGFALAPFVTGIIAYLTGLIALRAVRLYFALLTLAIGQLMFVVTFQWRGLTRGDDGIHGVAMPDFLIPINNRYYFLVFVTGLALAIMGMAMRSPFGSALQAIRENRERAGFLGLKVKRYELAAFTLGGAFAGYAGAMFVLVDRGAFPLLLHWTTSAQPIFVTLIGGMNSFAGPVVGAVIFALLRDWITRRFLYWGAVLGVVLLLIILRMPGGTVEGVQRLWARVRGRKLDPSALSSPDAAAGAIEREAEAAGPAGDPEEPETASKQGGEGS